MPSIEGRCVKLLKPEGLVNNGNCQKGVLVMDDLTNDQKLPKEYVTNELIINENLLRKRISDG
jgi:hypothetical protein